MEVLSKIELTPERSLSKDMLALCKSVQAKRAKTVIDHILKHGAITTEELSETYGYDHAPRAARDVRENGIPLITHRVKSAKTGRSMGVYTFGDVSNIRAGRIGGRKAFSKAFKQELIDCYGSKDALTGIELAARYLQIDHRVPYEVAGDSSGQELNPKDFMLLDATSNRSKSWSCERCVNLLIERNIEVCKTCFWASPEDYEHIAGLSYRRLDLVWTGKEVAIFDRLKQDALSKGVDIRNYVKKLLSKD